MSERYCHADRLERGYERVSIDGPRRTELRARITNTLDANDLREAAVRLSVTRGG